MESIVNDDHRCMGILSTGDYCRCAIAAGELSDRCGRLRLDQGGSGMQKPEATLHILSSIHRGPKHGWAIRNELRDRGIPIPLQSMYKIIAELVDDGSLICTPMPVSKLHPSVTSASYRQRQRHIISLTAKGKEAFVKLAGETSDAIARIQTSLPDKAATRREQQAGGT